MRARLSCRRVAVVAVVVGQGRGGRDTAAAAGRTRAGRCARASTCDPSAPGQSLLRAPPPAARPNLSFVSPISPRPHSPPACCARCQYLTAPSITCPVGMIAQVTQVSTLAGKLLYCPHYFFQSQQMSLASNSAINADCYYYYRFTRYHLPPRAFFRVPYANTVVSQKRSPLLSLKQHKLRHCRL